MREKVGNPSIKKIRDTSVENEKDASIYRKKYYKVVLQSIDPRKETVDSFAIKMAMRLRTPMSRVKQILHHLPCTVKSGMSVTQANKLYAVMEELGAKARIDSYFLTPGEKTARERRLSEGRGIWARNAHRRKGPPLVCPSCEWENEAGSEYCALCLAIFKKKNAGVDRIPSADEESAVYPHDAASAVTSPRFYLLMNLQHRWVLLGALLLILLVALILIKK
jgi:hypothetical protein